MCEKLLANTVIEKYEIDVGEFPWPFVVKLGVYACLLSNMVKIGGWCFFFSFWFWFLLFSVPPTGRLPWAGHGK